MQFIMQYGEQALKAIEQMMNDPKNAEQSDLLEQTAQGRHARQGRQGQAPLTPQAVSTMQQQGA